MEPTFARERGSSNSRNGQTRTRGQPKDSIDAPRSGGLKISRTPPADAFGRVTHVPPKLVELCAARSSGTTPASEPRIAADLRPAAVREPQRLSPEHTGTVFRSGAAAPANTTPRPEHCAPVRKHKAQVQSHYAPLPANKKLLAEHKTPERVHREPAHFVQGAPLRCWSSVSRTRGPLFVLGGVMFAFGEQVFLFGTLVHSTRAPVHCPRAPLHSALSPGFVLGAPVLAFRGEPLGLAVTVPGSIRRLARLRARIVGTAKATVLRRGPRS